MQKILPIYYSEYGRYINRFRAIPSYIDGLKPVERRLLLTLHKVAKNELVKSAEVVGFAMGNYHPHGDQSLYGTLVNLVNQGYAKKQGNWGAVGLKDDPPAGMRYTECQLEKWVEELAFTYIDYVPYDEFELKPEPIYLPCPIPIGLIGHGVTTGISFYRTLIPKYKLKDLAARLFGLIDNKSDKIITPNFKGCAIRELSPDQIKSILSTGSGTLNIVPNGKLETKHIKILGRVPTTSFSSLEDHSDELEISLNDDSPTAEDIEITVEPRKRGMNLTTLGSKMWDDYLIKNLNFSCLFSDNDGKVQLYGIDDILLNNYNLWKYSVKLKRVDDYNKLSNKKFEFMIVQIIRYIFEQYKCNKITEVVDKYKELKKTSEINIEIDNTILIQINGQKKLRMYLIKIYRKCVAREQLKI